MEISRIILVLIAGMLLPLNEVWSQPTVLLPFGVAAGDEVVPPALDGTSHPVSLSSQFYGVKEDTVYVSTNGVVSFGSDFTDHDSRSFPLSTSDILIAPFWADSNVVNGGQVLFRLCNNQTLLHQVGSTINDSLECDFTPTMLFIVTWNRIPQYGRSFNIVNTFQAVLATDGTKTFVMFLYHDIQWSSGTTIGFNAGDGVHSYTVPESLTTDDVINVVFTSNVGIPGMYIYRVDQDPYADVELKVHTTVDYITEPISGESVTVPVCYTALVYRTLNRNTTINIDALEQGIYAIDEEYVELSHQHFTIAADFVGKFTDCVNMIVTGNNTFAGNIIRIAMLFTTRNIKLSQCNSDVFIYGSKDILFPYGEKYGDQLQTSSADQKQLSFSCKYFGIQEDTIYVSKYGVISFRDRFEESIPRKFPYGNVPLMAPYWDDNPGDVLYRISNNQTILDKVSSHIADVFSVFSPTMLFIATWNRVPQSSSENNRLFNTFQAVIASDNSTNTTVVLFLYGDIQWSSGFSSTGFSSENGHYQESSTMDLETLTNIGQLAFRVDQETIQLSETNSGFGDVYITSIVLGIAFLITVIFVVGCLIRCYKIKLSSTGIIPLSEANSKEYNLNTFDMQIFNSLLVNGCNLRVGKSIGQGEFGVVYKGWLKNDSFNHETVAIKTLKGFYNNRQVTDLLKECAKMKEFDHPNVLSLKGVCLDGGPMPYIIMPFMTNGSLLYYLKENKESLVMDTSSTHHKDKMELDIQMKLLDMCIQVAKGMEYLASKRIIHRDLAARNCMVDSCFMIKVADFGLSENMDTNKEYFRQNEDSISKLPLRWLALESITDRKFSEKTDVWAFGVTCWEIFSGGKTPYPGIHPMDLLIQLERGYRMKKPVNITCTDEVYNIVRSCWEKSPESRPHFSQLVSSFSAFFNTRDEPLESVVRETEGSRCSQEDDSSEVFF